MRGNLYTLVFMLITCLACSLLVSAAHESLRSLQTANQLLDLQKNVLNVLKVKEYMESIPQYDANGRLVPPKKTLTANEIAKLYEEKVRGIVVNALGEVVELPVTKGKSTINQASDLTDKFRREQDDAIRSKLIEVGGDFNKLPEADRKEFYLPLYLYEDKGKVQAYGIPIYGEGLWDLMFGYLALESNANVVRGITYYQHKETPGLGGEVDNPNWKKQWPGKEILQNGELHDPVPIAVVKGGGTAGQPHAVDGISGATITSNGVQAMLDKDLQKYAPYFQKHVWQSTAATDSNQSAEQKG